MIRERLQSLSTPLHYAAANGNTEVVHLLLEANGDVEAQDNVSKQLVSCAENIGVAFIALPCYIFGE